jgi:type I restriction enzyme M protein
MPPRKRKQAPAKSLEATLWEAADKLRGNLEAAEYKHVVLGLVFLKYVSDAFTQRRNELEAALSDPESDEYIPNEARREKLLESRDEYAGANVFWVPPEARWEHLQLNAKQPKIGAFVDDAMDLLELDNPKQLKGVLPKNYAREDLDKRLLGELIDLIGSIGFTEVDHGSDDVLGKVYEYFLGKFAGQEDRGAGEYYTPRSVVRLLVEMLEPFHGRVYDPCCGSGGMFVQSAEFVAAHGGRRTDISVYGQEFVGARGDWRA